MQAEREAEAAAGRTLSYMGEFTERILQQPSDDLIFDLSLPPPQATQMQRLKRAPSLPPPPPQYLSAHQAPFVVATPTSDFFESYMDGGAPSGAPGGAPVVTPPTRLSLLVLPAPPQTPSRVLPPCGRCGFDKLSTMSHRQQFVLAVVVVLLLVAAFVLVLLYHVHQRAIWGGHAVSGQTTPFYELAMCDPFRVRQTGLGGGNSSYDVMIARTSAGCPAAGELVAAATRWPLPEGSGTLDVMLRLEDQLLPGEAYLPVVLLPPGHKALVTFSIVDAQHQEVYSPVTLQLAPEEDGDTHAPWATNVSLATEHAEISENYAEDLLLDFGEDLLEDVCARERGGALPHPPPRPTHPAQARMGALHGSVA